MSDGGRRLFFAASVIFLFSLPSIWGGALEAGPGIFNVFLLVLGLWLLVRVQEGSLAGGAGILLWAFLAGLSFSQNYVTLFSLIFLLVFWRWNGLVRESLKANVAPVLLVFLVGLTLYIYLAVRPVLDPGLGQPVNLFSRPFWVYFYGLDALRHSIPRGADFFTGQVPLLFEHLKNQSPHWIVSLVLLAVLLYAVFRLFRTQRRLFFWSLGLLLGFTLIQLWLENPKLSLQPALDGAGNSVAREITNTEGRFLIVFLLFGVYAVLGLAWLKDDLSRALRWIVGRLDFTEKNFNWLPGGGLLAVIVLLLLAPVWFNWNRTSLARDFTVLDYARNMFGGTDENGILIVSGDQEYYPVMYVKRYIYADTTRSVINYNYLVDPAYIKSLDQASPTVALNFTDQQVESLRPARLAEPYDFKAGKLQIRYPQGTVLLVRDLAVVDIVRANEFKRPVYFSGTLGTENMAGFDKYLTRRGLTVQLLESDPLESADSTFFWRSVDRTVIDINKSSHLLWLDYSYHTTVKDIPAGRRDRVRILFNTGRVLSLMADAFLMRNNVQQAVLNFRQTEFFDPEYKERLFAFASWCAREKKYAEAKMFAMDYFKEHPADALKWAGLAKMALDQADTTAATEMLVEAVKVDPDFQLGFTKLVRLYDATDQKLMASAFLSRWVARHPQDEQARKLWEQYSATKTLPPDFPD